MLSRSFCLKRDGSCSMLKCFFVLQKWNSDITCTCNNANKGMTSGIFKIKYGCLEYSNVLSRKFRIILVKSRTSNLRLPTCIKVGHWNICNVMNEFAALCNNDN